jgi:hypothetical protein
MHTTVLQALTQQRKKTATTLKGRVCELLGWNEMQYAEYQYNTGIEYMVLYTLNNEAICDDLVRSKIYWNWWKNGWANRDECFLVDNINLVDKATAIAIYNGVHDALALSEELRPDAIVLGDSYKTMIGEVIKKEVCNG